MRFTDRFLNDNAISAKENNKTTSNKKEVREVPLSEFRRFKKGANEKLKHPFYFFKRRNKQYYGIGITHSNKYNGQQQIKLDKNPQLNKEEQAYLNPFISKFKRSQLTAKLKNWKFTEEDMKKVNNIINNPSKKPNGKKNKKK